MGIDLKELAAALEAITKQKPSKPKADVTNVLFMNWSDEEFTHSWNNEPYTFKAGEQRWLPMYLAEHFANHLASREMNKKDVTLTKEERKAITHLVLEPEAQARAAMVARCFPKQEESFQAEHVETAQAEAFAKTVAENALGATSNVAPEAPRRGRPPKAKPAEDSFEG